MNELQENTFDYSILDQETAVYMEGLARQSQAKGIQFIIEQGKILLEGQERLKKGKYGCFEAWAKSLGFSDTTARKYINVANNLDGNIIPIENIQKSLLYEIAKPSANEELKQKVLDGEITKHKQYKELEKKLKQEQEARENLEKIAAELEENYLNNPKIVEVVPEDVKGELELKDRQLRVTLERLERLQQKYERQEAKTKQLELIAEEVMPRPDTKKELNELREQADFNILGLAANMRHFLEENAINAFLQHKLIYCSTDTKDTILHHVNLLELFCQKVRTNLHATFK